MKRTVNISLCGRAFIIDEDANNILENYLNDIKSRLKNIEERQEVMQDIEARVAEILSANIITNNQSVNIDMIRNIISQIGEPYYFGDNDTQNRSKESYDVPPPFNEDKHFNNGNVKHSRKWLRNTQDKIIGGVCSGTAIYLGVDTTIVRILLVILFFCYGFGLIPYIILWILLPTPKTKEDFDMLNNKK